MDSRLHGNDILRTVMNKKILLLTLVILITAACGSGEIDPSEFKGSLMPAAIPAPDFTLTKAGGEEVRLSDYEGKIVLLYFGYTFCPDVCPSSLSDLKIVQNKLDETGEKMQVIMVTVDPDRDTPEQIAEYVEHFHPTFIGLSGNKKEIDAAGEGYGVYYEKHEGTPATGYLVDHTARIFVIEPDGTYRLSFSFGTPTDDIISDMRLLMRDM
jgi:protein SCO1/2